MNPLTARSCGFDPRPRHESELVPLRIKLGTTHTAILLTTANIFFSAENRSVEFGVRINDPALAESVEVTMTSNHGSLYELAS